MKMNKLSILKLVIFYVLSFTWGIIMSFIGLFPLVYCAIRGKVYIYHRRLYGILGSSNWGGISLGCFFFVCPSAHETDEKDGVYLKAHECGHGLQNCVFGPLFPFIVGIPSAIRYWYRIYLSKVKKQTLKPYDAIWFEEQATELGKKYIITDLL